MTSSVGRGVDLVVAFTKRRGNLDYPYVRSFSGSAGIMIAGGAEHLERQVTKPEVRSEFAAIFRELRPYVQSALRGLGVPAADLEDACQEVFVVVHRKLATYEDRGALHAWLYGICVRVASHTRRRRARVPDPGGDALPEAVDLTTPIEQVTASEGRRILYSILDQLDDDKRAVFVLYELEELTMSEVARALGINLFTAYARLRAARAEVQQAIVTFSRQQVIR